MDAFSEREENFFRAGDLLSETPTFDEPQPSASRWAVLLRWLIGDTAWPPLDAPPAVDYELRAFDNEEYELYAMAA